MKKVKIVKTDDSVIYNHGLYGYLYTTYDELVKALGAPTYDEPSGDNKIKVEWYIEFSDGSVVAIYDWKNYDKTVEQVKETETTWNVGGNTLSYTNLIQVLVEKDAKFTAGKNTYFG